MSKIIWNETEIENREGLDQGVFADPETFQTYPWLGLISISNNNTKTAPEILIEFDGHSSGIPPRGGSYSGSLHAYMYPEEFNSFIGYEEDLESISPIGRSREFILIFRTEINGSSIYHIIWDLVAKVPKETYNTFGINAEISDFTLDISGSVKASNIGYYPYDHVVIDTRKSDPIFSAMLNETLFGEDLYNQREGLLVSADSFIETARIFTPIV